MNTRAQTIRKVVSESPKFQGNTNNILDRPISKGKNEVSLSAFSFLFSETVQYCQSRVNLAEELEQKLRTLGYGIGLRMLELCMYRDKNLKRETRLLPILQFVSGVVWKTLFGKNADELQKSTDKEDEYHIIEREPITNKYISVPKSIMGVDCASFIAGIVKGVLDGAEFPARVTAHSYLPDGERIPRTIILIKFDQSVIEREKRL